MKRRYLSLGQREELHIVKLTELIELGGVSLIAAKAVERLRQDDLDKPAPDGSYHPLI